MQYRPCSIYFLGLIGILFLVSSTILEAKETDQDMSHAPVGGSAMVDAFTGSLSTTIPIEVPPGRHGMQPNLGLAYWSNGGNGWAGMGWKLEVGAIERQMRFGLYVPDVRQLGSIKYRAKIEGGFSRMRRLIAGDDQPLLEITEKKGRRYLFGQTAGSRQSDPMNGGNTFKWCLDRVEDTKGNYMMIT